MKKLILIGLVACCFTSCKKFLEERSTTEIVPTTTDHFSDILYSDGYPNYGSGIATWATLLDDDVECYFEPTIYCIGYAIPGSPIYQWQPNFPDNPSSEGWQSITFPTWIEYYRLLLGANVVLQNIDEATGPEADRYRIKGEAYALRAYYHFMLVNFFAAPYNDSTTTPDKSPGIPIRIDGNLSDNYLKRNTVKEVYTQIENDLDSAIQLLSYNKTITDKTRMNYLAAHLLASRVYLYEEKWDKVIAHANLVLEDQSQLMDLNTWPGYPDVDNKPIVGLNNVETLFCFGTPAEKEVYGYAQAYNLSHDLVNTFEDGDLRAVVGFYVNPPELKFLIAPDFSQQKFNGSITFNYANAPCWRTSEAFLNRAEAYIQQYKTKGDAAAATEAVNDLNTLRSNRFSTGQFTPWGVQPADKLLQLCREERRRELYLEEMHRWFDLRRYGMPAIKHIYKPAESVVEIYTLKAHDKQYVMPLPESIIQRNPALTQSPQMTGTRLPD